MKKLPMTEQSLPRNSRGMTLVEIMVALTISLILLAGILTIFASSKATYRTQEALSRLQENGRYAINRIITDLRMAGYSGCNPNITNHLNPGGVGYSSTLFDFNAAVGGWEYSATSPNQTFSITTLDPNALPVSNWNNSAGEDLHTDLQNKVVAGTDVVATKRIVEDLNIPVSPTVITSQQIGTGLANTGIAQYTVLMITEDCTSSDLFQKRNDAMGSNLSKGAGSSTNPGPGNIDPPGFSGGQKWSKAYTADASILLPETAVFYIGMNSTSGEPTLVRATYPLGSTAPVHDELVEGVENMQVLYGEDTDATPDGIANKYVTIDAVSDINNITAVRISLLLRSTTLARSDTDTTTYQLTGHKPATSTTINPIDDRRTRQVFTATIKLRNRGIK